MNFALHSRSSVLGPLVLAAVFSCVAPELPAQQRAWPTGGTTPSNPYSCPVLDGADVAYVYKNCCFPQTYTGARGGPNGGDAGGCDPNGQPGPTTGGPSGVPSGGGINVPVGLDELDPDNITARPSVGGGAAGRDPDDPGLPPPVLRVAGGH